MAKEARKLLGNYRPHEPVKKEFRLPSRTKQEFREDCDVNVIIRRFTKTGVLPNTAQATPRYIDAATLPDLQGAMHIMIEAEKSFMSLPAQVRKEFDNSPMQFVEFATKPENLDKLREWGLAPKPEPEPGPQKVELVNPPPAPSSVG